MSWPAHPYILLRALQDDVADDDLCRAMPGRAIVDPADAAGRRVLLASDVIHAVEDAHIGKGYSNVVDIAAAPSCAKNDAHLARQLPSFLQGESPPDFPAHHFEVDFAGRATADHLTALGRS